MGRITLRVLAHNFAAGPPFQVGNNWRPAPVPIYDTDPAGADVIAAAIPARGGMRVVVYNREAVPVVVTVKDSV